jgi:hypothetical protein
MAGRETLRFRNVWHTTSTTSGNWAVSFDIKILFLTLARTIFPGAGALNESKHGGFRP